MDMDKLPKYSQILGSLFGNIGDGLGILYAIMLAWLQSIGSIPLPEGSMWANNILILSIAAYFLLRGYHYYRKGRKK
jgi:hypothetical protein